mmetsp:Transcript_84523/g.182190  ORF Transcript_84523/g.182190 Transcript_84523/m.182190 type:complete len:115 (+) Transcript_84523:639-983(+)
MLSGKMPFHSPDRDNINQLFRRIKSSNVEFKHEVWKVISDEAKDLILKMLDKKIKSRITVKEALSHPFFTNNRIKMDTKLDMETITNLRKWKDSSNIIKAYRLFLARIVDSNTT